MVNMDRDPKIQSSPEFVADVDRNGLSDQEWRAIHGKLQAYLEKENPRKMPAKWVALYLAKDRAQLAIDVIRSFDKTAKLEQQLRSHRMWGRVLWGALTLSWLAFWRVAVFAFEHITTIERMVHR